MLLDGTNDHKERQVLAPAAARNADVASLAVDRSVQADHDSCLAGMGYGCITFNFHIGNAGDTWGATDYLAIKLQESDDSTTGTDGTWTDVTVDTGLIYRAENIGGDIPITITSSKEFRLTSSSLHDLHTWSLGYAGVMKMVRAYLDFGGTHSTGTILAITVTLAHPMTF